MAETVTIVDYRAGNLTSVRLAVERLGWAALVLSLLMAAVIPAHTTPMQSRYLLIVAAIALLGLPTMALVAPLNQPEPNPALSLHGDIFVGGEGGYRIYRIPGLLVLATGSRLADGQSLDRDRILAFAEARRDGALDTGIIDLVMKYSEDGGYSWSKQAVVCKYRREGKRGKCGNATPVFDSISGKSSWLITYPASKAGSTLLSSAPARTAAQAGVNHAPSPLIIWCSAPATASRKTCRPGSAA